MSAEIVDQVRSYLETIESAAPPITVAELSRASIESRAGLSEVAGLDELAGEYPVEPRQHDGAAPVRRVRWSVGAVAAAAVLAVVSFGLFREGGGDGRPADPSGGPTQVGVDDATRQIVVVQAWAAAFNGGRLDEYLSYFSPAGVVVGPGYELIWGSPTDRETVAALMAAGDRMDSPTLRLNSGPLCNPLAILEPEDGSGDLSCWMFRRDRFHSAAVTSWPEDDSAPYWASPIFFAFDEDDRITSIRLGGSRMYIPWGWPQVGGVINGGEPLTETEAIQAARPFISYRTGFMDWIRAAHRDVATRLGPGVVGALPAADDMATALGYIDEFVAQTYPEADMIAALETDHDRHVATIEAMLGAYNRNDPEEWVSSFPDGIDLDDASGLSIEHEQAFMAANGRWTLTAKCEGTNRWAPFYAVVRGPGVLDDLPRRVLHCPTMREDDFYGVGGITRKVTFDFIFDDDGRLTGYATGGGDAGAIEQFGSWLDPHAEFARNFLTWLEATHPDVAVGFDSDGLITARDMPTALEYVDEFVAQSDTYPR